MRGVDGLKNGSPLGVEPKGEGIEGDHGFSTGSGTTSTTNAPAVKEAAPSTPAAAPSAPAKTDVKTEAVTQASLKPAP
jgi:hypothetical protein